MEQVGKKAEFKFKLFVAAVVYLFIGTIFLLPSVEVFSFIPTVQVSDLLFPISLGLLIINFSALNFSSLKSYIGMWGLMILVVLISLWVNDRIFVVQDLFEVYKLFKFLFFVVFIYSFSSLVRVDEAIIIVFILVLVFNIIHYFDILGFNHIVLPHYANELQWKTFGLNSEGAPDVKRLIGTVGNPNNNAILFLFFIIYFFPKNDSTWQKQVLYFLAVVAFLFCQSRTGLIAFLILFLCLSIALKYTWRSYLIHTCFYLLMFGFLNFSSYIVLKKNENYITNVGASTMKSGSATGRMKIWSILWEKSKSKPFFGYSPNKEFFYTHKFYPESEYFLYLYQYGFIGVAIFLLIQFFTLRITFDWIKLGQVLLFGMTLVYIITAIMNNPFNDQNLVMILALSAGLFFYQKEEFNEA